MSGASVTQHAVWWLWPNPCLLRYPGMRTPAFDQGASSTTRPSRGLSEHGVHHFHGLVLDIYRSLTSRS